LAISREHRDALLGARIGRSRVATAVAALSLVVAVSFGGCGLSSDDARPTTPAAVHQRWNGEHRASFASDIASDRLIIGWTRSQVHEALGQPDEPTGETEVWHNGCSGPDCYNLMVDFERGRVVSVTFLDEG